MGQVTPKAAEAREMLAVEVGAETEDFRGAPLRYAPSTMLRGIPPLTPLRITPTPTPPHKGEGNVGKREDGVISRGTDGISRAASSDENPPPCRRSKPRGTARILPRAAGEGTPKAAQGRVQCCLWKWAQKTKTSAMPRSVTPLPPCFA